MEDLGTCYAIIANDPELRRGVIRDAERSRRLRQASSIRRLIRGWLSKTLRGLAAYVEPSALTSNTTSRHERASAP
jgi:hypothetical protein